MTDTDSWLRIWKEHFSKLLVSGSSSGNEDITEPIPDDNIECIPPSQNEAEMAVAMLKNNKAAEADGLPAELLKIGGDTPIRQMHQFVVFGLMVETSMYFVPCTIKETKQ